MTPRVRFTVWVGAAFGTFAAAFVRSWMVEPGFVHLVLTCLNLAGVGGMLWLLLTTPVDAIKLNRWVSVAIVMVGGGLILNASVWSMSRPWEWVTTTEALWTQVHIFLMLTFGFWWWFPLCVIRWRARLGALVGHPSAWWGVVVMWSPVARPSSSLIGVFMGEASWGLIVSTVALLASFTAAFLGWSGIRSTAWVWLAFAAAAACSIALEVMATIEPL
ncbi:MAG: hypothetical protein AAGI53_13715 [Planctomycetota bacterium]